MHRFRKIKHFNKTLLRSWRGGRVVDCGGLENRCTARYPGFESLSLRFQLKSPLSCSTDFFFIPISCSRCWGYPGLALRVLTFVVLAVRCPTNCRFVRMLFPTRQNAENEVSRVHTPEYATHCLPENNAIRCMIIYCM